MHRRQAGAQEVAHRDARAQQGGERTHVPEPPSGSYVSTGGPCDPRRPVWLDSAAGCA